MDQPVFGQTVLRLMVIAPFFVMPTVSALVWKNLLMNPISGLFAWIAHIVGLLAGRLVHQLADAVGDHRRRRGNGCRSRALILLTALQSLDEEQKEAAALDGAGPISYFGYIVLPHIARAITVVILIETIFLLERVRRDSTSPPPAARASRRPTFPSSSTNRRCSISTSAAPRPAASSPSSSPTSSRSS